MVHFFLVGAVLFGFQRCWIGDSRTIVVTPGLEAELARRFQDLHGRSPAPAEFEAELRRWEHDEALFREALRRRLDRDDPSIRTVLVDKMNALAAFEVPERDPTEAELERWLSSHRTQYEAPRRYDFEFAKFPKAEGSAQRELERFERAIQRGSSPTSLGRPILGGNLTAADMKGRIAPELAARIPTLPPGQWQRFETDQDLLLARVKRVEGGLPSPEELRPRLVADWSLATRREAIERVLEQTVARYRFEERR
jgi:hypothetical protein